MKGDRLAELRKDHGLTQQQLADELGISVHTVKSYEQGKSQPSDEIIVKLAKRFNRSSDYLLGATDLEIPLVRESSIELPVGFPSTLIEKVEEHINLQFDSYKYKHRKK